ncbi:MAG: class I SAM-dependent methyltransferase [Deltaproteobacteria bacterium]|nr:class I SAM-dependent methyltransferase [Deltaproteobacteria bacterium]
MINLNNKTAYTKKFSNHLKTKNLTKDDAAKMHIGALQGFDRIGYIGAELIKRHLIREDGGFLIDVGCGSGRMASYLSDWKELKYLGTDVVKKILRYAKQRANRPDWEFKEIHSFEIPAENNSADAVCFFSVLTHLLHEQSFLYLQEAQRVIRPGGKIGFSFLEFTDRIHQRQFRELVRTAKSRDVLSIFFDRPAIQFWAKELGLEIVTILDGSKPMFHLDSEVALKDGSTISGGLALGQSFCVLEKKAL